MKWFLLIPLFLTGCNNVGDAVTGLRDNMKKANENYYKNNRHIIYTCDKKYGVSYIVYRDHNIIRRVDKNNNPVGCDDVENDLQVLR